jgi:hypothetical protein
LERSGKPVRQHALIGCYFGMFFYSRVFTEFRLLNNVGFWFEFFGKMAGKGYFLNGSVALMG